MPLELKLKATETPIRSELRPFPMASNEGRYPDILTYHQPNKKRRLYRTLYRPVSETARKMLRLIGTSSKNGEINNYFYTNTSPGPLKRRGLSVLHRTGTDTTTTDKKRSEHPGILSAGVMIARSGVRSLIGTRTTTDTPIA